MPQKETPVELDPASYRGAFFLVESTTTSGGRKDAKKEFVNSDRQLIEDLGLSPRVFTVNGTITERRATNGTPLQSYKDVRDTLLQALEKGGTGELVHPWFGALSNISARTWSIVEDQRQLNDTRISITFEVSDFDGQPLPRNNTEGAVERATEDTTEAATDATAEDFSVTTSFSGNFQDALAKANDVVDSINEATDPLAIVADELDSFSADLAEFSANVTSLVSNPQQLSDSISSLLATMSGVFQTPLATLLAFQGLFDYGADDVAFNPDTAGLLERRKNRVALDSTMRGQALAYAYLNTARVTFPTEQDLDEVSAALEAQYQALAGTDGLNICLLEALTAQRLIVLEFLEAQRLVAPSIVTVETNPTSVRLLTFQYYGSSEDSDAIALLNGFIQSEFIEGDVKILSD